MSAWFRAAFGMHQDADSQTRASLSQLTADLPTLLTGQKASPVDSKKSWTGLPAGITGSWKTRSATEPEKCTPEIPKSASSASINPIIRCKSEELQHLICAADLHPWDSKDLFQQRLDKIRLAYNTPLRAVKVVDGLRKFTSELGTVQDLDQFTFVKTLLCILDQDPLLDQADSMDLLKVVLESMDFKKSETLSVGEWAQGLVALFQGTQEEKDHAIFDLLDRDGDHYLSYEELKEYLKPFVKAMIPAEASVLQPGLLQHCTDEVLRSIKSTTCRVVAPSTIEKYGSDMVSYEEFVQWSHKHHLGDSLSQIIDTKVGSISLQNMIDDYRI